MVKKLLKPRDAADALAMLAGEPGSLALAGGTHLLSPRFAGEDLVLVSVAGILPAAISVEAGALRIGANATFQDLADSRIAPEALRRAALCMANRNVRNMATVGGNLGANKACGSLPPLLIAAGATLRLAGGEGEAKVEDWLTLPAGSRRGLVESVLMPLPASRSIAYRRWSRTACDLSVIIAAAALDRPSSPGAPVAGLRIALGGMAPIARRFPELEALFEGGPFPGLDAAQAAIAPLLRPVDDLRGSAAFKRLRGAALLAEAMAEAAGVPAPGGKA